MAIIYTYPKLSNPQGNELIVVSDVNNRNSTRLITIASIASLIPTSGGCAEAISGIVDNVGNPLYSALACSNMELVSSDNTVTISATATGIDLTVDPSFTLPCASAATLGGILANDSGISSAEPASSGDYYPVEITSSGCTGVVRVPNSTPDCATDTRSGVIKVGAGTADNIVISSEGEYYAVQVDENCVASVRVPSSTSGCSDVWKTITNTAGTFSASATGCDDTLTLSSTLGTINISSSSQGIINFDVDSLPCATPTDIGGIKVADNSSAASPVIDESGTLYAVETNTSCEAFVRVPTSSGSPALNGFSPLDIYSGTSALVSNFTIAQQTISDVNLTGVNTVDFAGLVDNVNRTIQCHIWEGKMNDSGSATFLGSGSLTGITKGINSITLSTFDLAAGSPIVIYFTADKVGDGTTDTVQVLVGDGLSGADFLCQSSNAYTATPSNVLTTALSTLSESDEFTAKRVACHFYKS